MVHHGRVITKTFLTQGTVMTAFGQSHLNGWVTFTINVRPNQAMVHHKILDSHFTPEVS